MKLMGGFEGQLDGAHRSQPGDTTHDFNSIKPFTYRGGLYNISMASVCYVPRSTDAAEGRFRDDPDLLQYLKMQDLSLC